MEEMSCIYKTEERYNKRNAYILEIKNKKEREREIREKKQSFRIIYFSSSVMKPDTLFFYCSMQTNTPLIFPRYCS